MNRQSNTNLDIDINLRSRVQLGHHSSLKRLLQVEGHLSGFAVSVWSSLPLRCAERGHAILAVDNCSIMKSPTSRTSHLEENDKKELMYSLDWTLLCLHTGTMLTAPNINKCFNIHQLDTFLVHLFDGLLTQMEYKRIICTESTWLLLLTVFIPLWPHLVMFASSRIASHITHLYQVSLIFSNDLYNYHVSFQRSTFRMWRNRRLIVWMCNQQINSHCVMLISQ